MAENEMYEIMDDFLRDQAKKFERAKKLEYTLEELRNHKDTHLIYGGITSLFGVDFEYNTQRRLPHSGAIRPP